MRTQQTRSRKDSGRRAKRMPRRGTRRGRRPEWVGRLRRFKRVLAASWRIMHVTLNAADRVADRAARCPIRTSRDLQRLEAHLLGASARLRRALRVFEETKDSMLRESECPADAPWLLTEATVRWLVTAQALAASADELFALHEKLLEDVRSGLLTPEAETPRRRPRIITVQHLISARDFLLCRRSSAHDRIASIPARRRRTSARPAADAPRRISRGRAPPLVSNCPL
jgi:hypothetical protein